MAAHDYEELNRRLSDQAARVRDNANLSADGKRRLIAAAVVKAQATAAEWREADAQANARARRMTEQRLFGLKYLDRDNPAAIVSMRDAHERASRINTAAEATKLLDRAVTSGDYALQRAILARAFEAETSDMSQVVEAYVAHNPDTREDIEELAGFEMATARENTPAGKLFGHMLTTVIAPPEVNGVDPWRLEQLAAESGDVIEQKPPAQFDSKTMSFSGGQYRVAGDDQPSVDG